MMFIGCSKDFGICSLDYIRLFKQKKCVTKIVKPKINKTVRMFFDFMIPSYG